MIGSRILAGGDFHKSARDIHPSLNNQDLLAYHMNKFKQKRPRLELKTIGQWKKDQGIKVLKKVCLDPGDEIIII